MNILNSCHLRTMGAITLASLFCAVAYGADWYVATNGTGGGTSWTDATNDFQGAITKSSASDIIWVSNGVYETGGLTNYPAATILTNRVVITKAITVRSLNGPAVTAIKGAWSSDGNTNGPDAVRCVYMVANSKLYGFTLTNGATANATGLDSDRWAGGVYCPSILTPIISNCVIAGNSANYYGGGGVYGTFHNCIFTNNTCFNRGGATLNANMYNCLLVNNSAADSGGGARAGVLSNCTLRGNSTLNSAGGASYAYLFNCLLVGNTAGGQAGGAYAGTLCNCTIVSNSSVGDGGGVKDIYGMTNCISWDNNKQDNTARATNSCGVGANYTSGSNFTNDPQFVDSASGNYRLRKESPCVNTGTNGTWTTAVFDLDGRPRVRDGTVDRGCYEYINPGSIFIVH